MAGDKTAKSSSGKPIGDPYRFAGKNGIDKGPVPLRKETAGRGLETNGKGRMPSERGSRASRH